LAQLAIRGKLQCVVCQETIESYEDARRCENEPMHDGCLKCISCHRSLGDFQVKFFKNKERTLFHCEPCLMDSGERCPYCKDMIEQNQGKLYKGKKYHRRCVELVDVCDECGRSLVESTHMLSLDEPKKESKKHEPEVEGATLSQQNSLHKKQSPSSPKRRSSRPSRISHGSKKSLTRGSKSNSRSSMKGKTTPTTEGAEDHEEDHHDQHEDDDEEEKKNVLTPKKQYCQECFKHIYHLEICHVCKGPLKKNEEETEPSVSTLQRALVMTQNQLGVESAAAPGRKISTPAAANSKSNLKTLENAFKFPEGQHPEEFLFEEFICHWDCMHCHTCQKSIIGEPSFIMAEKHKIWCKFCAAHRFASVSPSTSPAPTSLSTRSPSKSSKTGRGQSGNSLRSGGSLGSNMKFGIGPTDVREFKFNAKSTRYELEQVGSGTSGTSVNNKKKTKLGGNIGRVGSGSSMRGRKTRK